MPHDKEFIETNPIDELLEFIEAASGLELAAADGASLSLLQLADQRLCRIPLADIDCVIHRVDFDGEKFLQVNFSDGRKILITSKLIGFRPDETVGVDLSRLPRVVTTPDLVSVIEALEDAMSAATPVERQETGLLESLFHSVLNGAEVVGFDLSTERAWLKRLYPGSRTLSA